MTGYVLVGLAAAFAAFVHRAVVIWIYRSWFRQGFAGDAAFHLAVVRQIKRTGSYGGVSEFLIRDESDTYPVLFHRIAALFPVRLVERFPYLPNTVIWVVMTSVVTIYVHYVASRLLNLTGPQFALTFLLLFLGSASNVALDMNGLNYISLSERLLSRFCCGLHVLALIVFITYGDGVSFAASIVFGTLTLISSMFGRQTMSFVTPLVSLFSLSVWPLLVVAASFLGAVVVDRGYFLRGLRHMSQFSHAYRNHTKNSRYYQLGLSRFVRLEAVFGRGRGIRSRVHELEHNEPTRVAFRQPELILLLALTLVWPGHVTISEIAVIAATLVVYVATSTAALRHYGEAGRYIEFALFLVPFFVLSKYVWFAPVSPAMWLIYAGWVVLTAFKKYDAWGKLVLPQSDVLSNFVRPLQLTPEATVFTVPFSLGAALHARTGCRSLMYQGSAVTLRLYEKFMEEIPFLKRDWMSLAREFEITHIVCERSYLDATKPLMGWEYDFSSIEKVAESDRYVAFRPANSQRSEVS